RDRARRISLDRECVPAAWASSCRCLLLMGGDDNLRAFSGGVSTMKRIAPLLLVFCCAVAAAQTQLKVKMFPGAQSLPALAAVQQGMFERQGLKVEVLFTANSDEQRNGLAKGEFESA